MSESTPAFHLSPENQALKERARGIASGRLKGLVEAGEPGRVNRALMTALGQDWFNYSPSTLNLSQALVQRYVHPDVWDPGILKILVMPSWLVFGVLALIFGLFGRRVKKRWQDQYGA